MRPAELHSPSAGENCLTENGCVTSFRQGGYTQTAYLNGYYDEMVDFLRHVFSAALKTNDALEKGILTGCRPKADGRKGL